MAAGFNEDLQWIAPIGGRVPVRVLPARHEAAQILAGLTPFTHRQQVVGLDIFQRHCSLIPDLWVDHTASGHHDASSNVVGANRRDNVGQITALRPQPKTLGQCERIAHRMLAAIAPATMSSAMMPVGVFC